ncbi:MAG: hypothetical protein RR268_04080 [Kiritimatiellia bacterium]
MKQMLAMMMVAVLCVWTVCAATPAAMTPADFSPAKVKATIAALPPAERQAYAKQVIEGVSSQAIEGPEKVQQLTSVSRALILGAGSEKASVVMAELFNSIPADCLAAVAKLLMPNFSQATNKMTDVAYDDFCKKFIQQCGQYLESSGTDAPAMRASVMTAMLVQGSSDPNRSRETFIAALPSSMAAAAAILVIAAEKNDSTVLGSAAGVSEGMEETPADPDSIVETQSEVPPATNSAEPGKDDDYLDPQPPKTGDEANGQEPKAAAVPLIARSSTDSFGQSMDMLLAVQFGWETKDSPLTNPPLGGIPGMGNVTSIPGTAMVNMPKKNPTYTPVPEPPSPPYGNQGIGGGVQP